MAGCTFIKSYTVSWVIQEAPGTCFVGWHIILCLSQRNDLLTHVCTRLPHTCHLFPLCVSGSCDPLSALYSPMALWFVRSYSSKLRHNFAKLRLSNHNLPIERGRYKNIELKSRTCKMCNADDIGDELHLLMNCKSVTLVELRKQFLSTV